MPGETFVPDHPGHVQILDHDSVSLAHEAGGELVQTVAALVAEFTTPAGSVGCTSAPVAITGCQGSLLAFELVFD